MPITAIAAIGVGMLMISGEFDISVAGTFTLVPFIVAITFGNLGWALLARAARRARRRHCRRHRSTDCITTRLGIPSFIATLGMMFILRGVIRFVSINPKTNQPDSIAFFPPDWVKSVFAGNIVGPLYAQMVWLAIVALIGLRCCSTVTGSATISSPPAAIAACRARGRRPGRPRQDTSPSSSAP